MAFFLLITCIIIFLCSVPFNGPTNEAVVSTLVKEVVANNPQFQACDIRGNYFHTTKVDSNKLVILI